MLCPAPYLLGAVPGRVFALLELGFESIFDAGDSRLVILGTWIGRHLFIALENHTQEWDVLERTVWAKDQTGTFVESPAMLTQHTSPSSLRYNLDPTALLMAVLTRPLNAGNMVFSSTGKALAARPANM